MRILIVLVMMLIEAIFTWPLEAESISQRRYGPTKPLISTFGNQDCTLIVEDGRNYITGPNCNSIRNVTVNGTNLHVSETGVVRIEAGDFDLVPQLKSLTIEKNTELTEISVGAFEVLSELRNLTITSNLLLQFVDSEVFRGLKNLRLLRLNRNNLYDLHRITIAVRPEILPSLVTLELSKNSFFQITTNDFQIMNRSPIENLHLSSCSLALIDADAFNGLPHLRFVDVSYNSLTAENIVGLIRNISEHASNFTAISFRSTYVTDPYQVFDAVAEAKLTWVDASYCHYLQMLYAQLMPVMENLEYLDLSAIEPKLSHGEFDSRKFPNIKFLYLASNRLLSSSFSVSLPKLQVLDLSDNSDSVGYNIVSVRDSSYVFENMSSLEELNLSSNRISVVRANLFSQLTNLRNLRLSNASIEKIDPLALYHLKNLEFLDLSHNSFPDTRSLNKASFAGLVNLRILILDFCEITCFADDDTFQDLSQLRSLSLAHNSMLELHHRLLLPATNLEYVDLTDNSFQSWNLRIFEKNSKMNTLILSFNQITRFNPTMLEDVADLQELRIDNNPFSCQCSDLALLGQYLTSPTGNGQLALVRALNESNPFCTTPASLRFHPLVQYAKAVAIYDSCNRDGTTVIIVASVCSLSVIIVLGAVASYFLRWHIKYWLFLVRQFMSCHIFPETKTPTTEGKYKYDAFVSYSNEDRGFVVRLVSMLESHAPHFRLCVFERDFDVGGIITDSVVDSLAKSKRTILILSDAYAKSTWCQWEMQLAQHKRLFFKDDRHGPLIIIKIGEIMEKHMTPTLRYLIKTRIYLQWNSDPIKQKVFWEKLRNALSASMDDDDDSRPNLQQAVLSNSGSVMTNIFGKIDVTDLPKGSDETSNV